MRAEGIVFDRSIPLKLKHLLNEISAAEKAKQLGYTAKPFGYWEKDGKVVARTQDDQLIPVNQDQSQSAAKDRDLKPTTMSADQAGKTIGANVPQKQDFLKQKTDSEKAIEKRGKEQAKQAMEQPPVPPLPTRPQYLFAQPIDKSGVESLLKQCKDPTKFAAEEGVIGEEVMYCGNNAWTEWKRGAHEKLNDEKVIQHSAQDSLRNASEFWEKLPPLLFEEMVAVRRTWQNFDQFRDVDARKAPRNALINSVCDEYRPAAETPIPLERGMSMDANTLKEFLKEFRIGQDLDLPPSGFSYRPRMAREWSGTSPERCGVVLRLHPNRDGKVYGLQLNGLPPRSDIDNPDVQRYIETEGDDYHSEHEVIRPSGPKARCIGVRKMLIPDKRLEMGDYLKVAYVIDLEEQGYDDEQIQENINKDRHNPVFDNIMNTAFGYWNPKRRKTEPSSRLKDIVGDV